MAAESKDETETGRDDAAPEAAVVEPTSDETADFRSSVGNPNHETNVDDESDTEASETGTGDAASVGAAKGADSEAETEDVETDDALGETEAVTDETREPDETTGAVTESEAADGIAAEATENVDEEAETASADDETGAGDTRSLPFRATAELDGGESPFAAWSFSLAADETVTARVISRTGDGVRVKVLKRDELSFYEDGEDVWLEHESAPGAQYETRSDLDAGTYALVVEEDHDRSGDATKVTAALDLA